MSGLNINLDKTKASWNGTMCKSDKILCREFNLDWEQKTLKNFRYNFYSRSVWYLGLQFWHYNEKN